MSELFLHGVLQTLLCASVPDFVLLCAPVAGMNDKNMIVIIEEHLINFT